jgi:hypothetical protein
MRHSPLPPSNIWKTCIAETRRERQVSASTKYDDQLENYSKEAITDEAAAVRSFRERVSSVDPNTLSPANQLDRDQLLHELDSRLLKESHAWRSGPVILMTVKTRTRAEVPALLVGVAATAVHGWGGQGHRLVGRVVHRCSSSRTPLR